MPLFYSQQIIKRLRHLLLVAAAAIFLIIVASTLALIYSNRSDQLDQVGRSMHDMSMVLSGESDATLNLASAMLEEATYHIQLDSENHFIDPEKIYHELQRFRTFINEKTGNPSFSHLFLLGADGFNVVNTVSYPPKKVDASDREFFIYHKNHYNSGLHISQPNYSRVTGERVIYLTRRISNTQGEFCGVIGIQLRLSHFDRLYKNLNLPSGSAITVIRKDGTGIYRYPMVDSFLQTSVKTNSDFQAMLIHKSDYLLKSASPYDATDRVVGFTLSQKFPIISIISVTQNAILRHWWNNSIKTLLLAGFACIALFIMTYFTYQQLGNLDRAIHLSNLDPLTSLGNRRAFDDHLSKEWRRARRKESSISLLFIDIDYFKRFNDYYGHRKGDICLIEIARAISQCASRSGEQVTRYGGEEFIVVLPDSDEDTALSIAQRIIQTISDLNIPHADSRASDRVTVSIGLASIIPALDQSKDDLIDFADKALYQAKEQGRNQICVNKKENLAS